MSNDVESMKKKLGNYAKQSRETVISNETLFDSKLTYICGGTLAISLTFMKDIVKLDEANYVGLLISSWIILTITLFLNLLSCPLSAKYARETEKKIKETIKKEYDSIESFKEEKSRINKKNNKNNKRVYYLNWICLFGVTAGIFLMIIFASINIQNKKTKMAKKTITNKQEKGRNQVKEPTKTYIKPDQKRGKEANASITKKDRIPVEIKGMTTPDMGDD